MPGKTVPGAIKLASNETVFGPLPSVRAAIEQATDDGQPLPRQRLRASSRPHLAKHLGPDFAPEHVAVGCGSVSLCQQLIQITAVGRRRGDVRLAQLRALPAAGPGRRRDRRPGAADRPHLRPRRDARRDHRPHPADLRLQPEQSDVHRRRPGRAGPVRRGGSAAHPDRHRRGLRRVHPRRHAARQLGLVRAHRNVVVLRTFSKAYGLAGPARRLCGRRPRRHHRAGQGLRAVHA